MSMYNNKGQLIGGSIGGVEKLITEKVEPLQNQINSLENQLASLSIEHERVLTEVESLRKTVETLASESLKTE